jgi:hypothetical protein
MKKLLTFTLLTVSLNAFALEIHNPDGSSSYVVQDPSGSTVIRNPGGSDSYVTQDPSGATRIDNGDGTTSYITN